MVIVIPVLYLAVGIWHLTKKLKFAQHTINQQTSFHHSEKPNNWQTIIGQKFRRGQKFRLTVDPILFSKFWIGYSTKLIQAIRFLYQAGIITVKLKNNNVFSGTTKSNCNPGAANCKKTSLVILWEAAGVRCLAWGRGVQQRWDRITKVASGRILRFSFGPVSEPRVKNLGKAGSGSGVTFQFQQYRSRRGHFLSKNMGKLRCDWWL